MKKISVLFSTAIQYFQGLNGSCKVVRKKRPIMRLLTLSLLFGLCVFTFAGCGAYFEETEDFESDREEFDEDFDEDEDFEEDEEKKKEKDADKDISDEGALGDTNGDFLKGVFEEVLEEDITGIVPLSKRINKGKMIAFGCAGDVHNAQVYKIYFFNRGKVTVVSKLEEVEEYGGFDLPSFDELLLKSDEELWGICEEFKATSEDYVQALKTNYTNIVYDLISPSSATYDASIEEYVKSQPDSVELYNILLPVIDAPFVISVETDETNNLVAKEQVVIAAQRAIETYGGKKSKTGEVDSSFYLTNMAEGGEIELGTGTCSLYPACESNIEYLLVKSENGFYFDALDEPNIYINQKGSAYEAARMLFAE